MMMMMMISMALLVIEHGLHILDIELFIDIIENLFEERHKLE